MFIYFCVYLSMIYTPHNMHATDTGGKSKRQREREGGERERERETETNKFIIQGSISTEMARTFCYDFLDLQPMWL